MENKENTLTAIIVDSKILLKRYIRRFLLLIVGAPFMPLFWLIGIVFGHGLDFKFKDLINRWVYSWKNA